MAIQSDYMPETTHTIQEAREDRIFKRVFLSPAVIVLLVLSIFPLLWSLGISVTNCQRNAPQQAQASQDGEAREERFTIGDILCLGTDADFTLENFQRMPNDSRLLSTARNTLLYVGLGVVIQYVMGFGLAMLLNQEFFGRRFFRLIYLLPMMITPVAAGYAGRMMFDSRISPLAQLLRTIGTALGNLTGQPVDTMIPWLTDTAVAPITIVLIDSWQWIPFMTLLLLAGMQAIPDEIYEAARVDGANAMQIIFRITFPILLPISLTAILIRSLEMFKIVDIVRVVTGGGPGTSTESLVMYVFDTALSYGNYAYAAAIAIVLLIMVIVVALVFLWISRRTTQHQLGV